MLLFYLELYTWLSYENVKGIQRWIRQLWVRVRLAWVHDSTISKADTLMNCQHCSNFSRAYYSSSYFCLTATHRFANSHGTVKKTNNEATLCPREALTLSLKSCDVSFSVFTFMQSRGRGRGEAGGPNCKHAKLACFPFLDSNQRKDFFILLWHANVQVCIFYTFSAICTSKNIFRVTLGKWKLPSKLAKK